MTYFHATGKATNVNNTRVDLWDSGSAYVFPPAGGIQMQVVSSSANDTFNGTGSRTVDLHYLDHNYNTQHIIITMSGTTPVTTVPTDILRVQYFHTSSSGSSGLSAGNIVLQSVGGGVTYAQINAGYNTSRQGTFTMPDGMVGYITKWHGSSGTTTGTHYTEFELRMTQHEDEVYPVFLFQEHLGCLNSGRDMCFEIPLKVAARVDIKISVISDASNANAVCVGGFMGWYQPIN